MAARLDGLMEGGGFFRGSSTVVSGTAGTGKSSVIRAGVLPLLAERVDGPTETARVLPVIKELAAAGVVLGDTYPAPIVDHAEEREEALARLAELPG